MRKLKKLTTAQLQSLAMLKYEYETISKIMVVGLSFFLTFFAFVGDKPFSLELNGLTVVAVLVLIQSIIFLLILNRFKGELADYLSQSS